MNMEARGATKARLSFRRHRAMPSILQTESAECGLACIAMVVSHFGHRVGLPEMRKRFSMSQKGGSFGDLIQVARRMHLASRAVKLDLTSLDKLKTPCILHWEFNHFVVLERVKAGLAHIHDPAHGFRKVSMEIVSRSFTGAALELWPTGEFRQGVEREAVSLSRLIGSLTGLRGTFAQLLTLSFSLEIFVLAAPFFIQWTLDHAVPSGDRDLMLLLAIGFLTLAMCQHVTAVMRSWLLMYLGASWNVRWCSNIFSHLIRLPVDYFIKRHLGDLISKFGAVDEIQRTVTTSFLEGTLDGVMTFLTLLLMFLYSPTLAAVVCLSAALYTLVRVLWFSPLRAAVQTHLIHASKQQTHFLETLRGIRAIKLFSREDERRSAWLSLLADQVNADICVQRLTLLYKHSNGLLSSLENILIVWLGAAFVIDGQLTIGALMAFIAYKMQFQTRVSSLIDKVADYRMLSVQADRLSDIALAKAEDIEDAPRSTEIITEVRVDVSNLGFRYGDFEPRILEGVSFTIHPGESVAITGPSGCGKSTLAHLLLGILTPTAGEIVLTGAQSKHMDAHALRRAFGTVMQDDMLLAGSLSENISFFAPDADMTWVVACAELACIHDEIQALPMRYDTLVGDMGSVLSGGQKQRILLARALYKKPACLLLDEATSHLDIACERQVNAAVRSLKMTRIIIAHRPETIASADRVLRLEHGKIVSS